jgi:Zn-dependent peptidase ImmA (M78 family)
LVARSKAWSAAIIPIGRSRIIIENDAHQFVRRRSNLAHEMSHHLLEHGFPDTLLTEEHDRAFSPKLEKEALFLSGELLVPRKRASSSPSRAQTMPPSALASTSALSLLRCA